MSEPHLYKDWSNDLRRAELASLGGVRADAWLRIVTRLAETDEKTGVRVADSADSARFVHLGRLRTEDRLAVRLFRYLSSEQLFALLLSGQGDMPFPRFTSKFRNDQLNQAYASIAKRVVPPGCETIAGATLDLSQWLTLKISGSLKNSICDSLVEYLVREADFVAEREFVNAIKHGRARLADGAGRFCLEVELEGEWVPLFQNSEAISVECWSEQKSGAGTIFSHSYSYESFNFEDDIGVLYVNSKIASAMLAGRKALLAMYLADRKSVSTKFDIPNNIIVSNTVDRVRGVRSPEQVAKNG